jgi:hypothetical protein
LANARRTAARRTTASAITSFVQLAYRRLLPILEQRKYNREASSMRIQLQSAHVVAIIAIALFTALTLAMRFRTTSWRGIVLEALIANIGAIAAVVAFEIMTS